MLNTIIKTYASTKSKKHSSRRVPLNVLYCKNIGFKIFLLNQQLLNIKYKKIVLKGEMDENHSYWAHIN